MGLTGTEAISDGVPAFKPPEDRNARVTLLWMAAIFGTLLLSISFLAGRLHIGYRWRIVVACLSNSGSAECLMPRC